MRARLAVSTLLFATFLLIPAAPVFAWEADLHYVLTWWLATKAGFSNSDAEEIAQADLQRDEGWLQPATAAMLHVYMRGDKGAAQDTRDKHFPVDQTLGNPPDKREVKPGSPYAFQPARAIADDPNTGPTTLEQLGFALHRLQDSWAHQGIPDTPARPAKEIHPDLSWSHPQRRGGWYSHNADLTFLHVDDGDTEKTAEASFGILKAFLDKHPTFIHTKREAYSSLSSFVASFAKADSKAAKREWIRKYATGARRATEVSDTLSIPGSSRVAQEVILIAARAIGAGGSAPQSVMQSIATLLQIWLGEQDAKKAASFVNTEEVGKQFGDGRPTTEGVQQWCRKFFTMWLSDDHGAFNRRGHGDPTDPQYDTLPESVDGPGDIVVPRSNVRVPGLSPEAVWRTTSDDVGVNGWATVLRFSHAPHDAVFIVFSDTGERIVRMFSVVVH